MPGDRQNFTGEGFSKEPFSDEERAQHRERAHHYDRHFLSVDVFLERTGLKWVSQMGKAAPAFIKAFTAISAFGAAVVVMKSMGWL